MATQQPEAKKKGNPIAAEQAEVWFDDWAEAMDLDLDTEHMDAEDLTAFGKQKRRIIQEIERGFLIFNDEGEAVFTPHNKKSKVDEAITFHERTGADVMAMDGKKKNQDMAKTYSVMASMCKIHPSVFSKLAGSDGKVCDALFALLMD